ncbi:MAG: hypothetical protein COW44_05475 [Flavobacteriaceae bacterium CG17_big_fil_post_rev_8_21_14_2_50_33_15]|nr:MAG: hypothetical protein COW44_05475 [Flavobacteriaceae bacterium CG17_big_fil_post_rev_8_21_14_2_50_33_15]
MSVNVGHVGIMSLMNGVSFTYGIKKYLIKTNTMVYYTQKGIDTFLVNSPTVEEQQTIDHLNAKSERALISLGYLGKIKMDKVKNYS